jgi:plasmid maintenance system killer protein
MKIEFKNNKIRRQLSTATEIKKSFGANAKKVAARVSEIEASPNLLVLMQIPAANCHQLTGNKKGEWALNISPNHRMIFEISHDPVPVKEDKSINMILVTDIIIIGTEDYH